VVCRSSKTNPPHVAAGVSGECAAASRPCGRAA
jgi:hypothetical protein